MTVLHAQSRPRDPRLDFFRGIAMFIILLAHTPGNPWTLWIPARFGFSDATEIFVFCSGMASAIAFGKVFDLHGVPMGTLRIGHRVWQVYWSHVAMFFAVFLMVAALNMSGLGTRDYVGQLNLYPFINNPVENLVGLMTLTYVPNYFDILPMYLVILAMVPLVMAFSRVSPRLALGAVALVWLGAQAQNFADEGWAMFDGLAERLSFLHLPAQYWFEPPNDTREWFFNPFAWQLVFFTGFAFVRGWIPAPPVTRWLIALALVIVLANAAIDEAALRVLTFDWMQTLAPQAASELRQDIIDWRIAMREWTTKTDQGLFRYVHFLAMAYLAWAAAGTHGARLSGGRAWTALVTVIRRVGQQSLAVFVTSMVLARFLGFLLDVYAVREGVPDKDPLAVLAINAFGFAVIIAVAYIVRWFKSQPWRKAPQHRAEPEPEAVPVSRKERAA